MICFQSFTLEMNLPGFPSQRFPPRVRTCILELIIMCPCFWNADLISWVILDSCFPFQAICVDMCASYLYWTLLGAGTWRSQLLKELQNFWEL